MTQAI